MWTEREWEEKESKINNTMKLGIMAFGIKTLSITKNKM
jgi:hypothetical protein